jgi:gluconate 2-dehydrogenase gamma chain
MLTALQRRTLAAVVGRILPSEGSPGAAEAGVPEACGEAIMGDFFSVVRPHVLDGLDRLQAAARERFGRDFPDCSPGEQDELLRAVDRARDKDWRARLFLNTLVHQTLEGFLGDPIHGGNRDGIGWRAIGYAASRVRSGLCAGEGGPK